MGMPAAAKKQIEEAEKLYAEAYPSTEEKKEEAEPEKAEAEATAEVVQEEVKTDDAVAESKVVEEVKKPEPEQKAEEPWEQRYKSLQGKYNAEVPTLQAELQLLRSKVRDLESAAELAKQEDSAPVENFGGGEPLVKEEEIDEYGAELISIMRRAAQEELNPRLAEMQKENAQLQARLASLGDDVGATKQERFLSALDSDPGMTRWRETNSDPNFVQWLGNIDPYSGKRKLDLLQEAFKENNLARTKVFFEGYWNENAAINAEQPTSARTPQVDAATLVSPGKPKQAGNARAQEVSPKQLWTNDDITKFYNDVRNGKYRSERMQKERARIEQDIIEAAQEGRIR